MHLWAPEAGDRQHGAPRQLEQEYGAYWNARVIAAHTRQTANMEFPTPLSVISRRVLQTLAIALWRINASRIMQFHRRARNGAQQVRNSNEAEALAVGPGDGS